MRNAIRSLIFLPLALLIGCTKPPAARPETPPAPVTVSTAGKKTVPVQLRTIGSVKAVTTVSVRPRVGGLLTGVYFKEGDFVEEKQKLFTIDPRPYQAAVRLAEANAARNAALLAGAEMTLKRAEQARTSGIGAAADYEAAITAVASAKAAIEADEAAIHAALIQAGHATIVSPLNGRVGELLVDRGNLVDANSITPLVVINQMNPIHVAFTLPEQHLPVVAAARKRGPLKVEVDLRGGGPLAVGELVFVDNTADPLTGTVQFKAIFDNTNHVLWPGLFVDVVLTLGERTDSIVVPASAIQSGQKGQYVYTISPDKKAELKPVEVAFEVGGEAVIASGLVGGEVVVVEGQLRLAPGTKVDAKPHQVRPGSATPPVPRVVAGGGK